MIKKILGKGSFWLLGLIALSIWTIYVNHLLGAGLVVVWGILPFVSFLLNYMAKKHITMMLNGQAVIAKNKKNVFLNKGRFFAYCDSHRFPTELSRM